MRLVQVQLYHGQELSSLAAANRLRSIPGEDFPRGAILDRNGLPLTDTEVVPSAAVFPQMLEEGTAARLADILGVPESAVSARLQSEFCTYFPNLTPEQAQEIQALQARGVYILDIRARYGPNSLARHIVGHVNSIDRDTWNKLQAEGADYKLTDVIGVKGIESLYEDVLHPGSPAFFWSAMIDAHGDVIPGVSFVKEPAPDYTPRSDVVLTIDRGVQTEVEKAMDAGISTGAVVVMDCLNGDILAAASRPNYDQNLLAAYLQDPRQDEFNNRILEHYFPGSIFKLLVATASLEEKVVAPDDKFICSGSCTLDTGLTINCWKTEGHGELTFTEGLANSCNVVFIETALKLGREKLLEYGEKFNLNSDDIVGYPGGHYPALNVDYGEGALANAAVGQEGVRLTPVKVAEMVSAIANGGYYVQARLVKETRREDGGVLTEFAPAQRVQIISGETAKEVQAMMVEVTKNGTGKSGWLPGYGTGGKTGSAETGRVDANGQPLTNAWFAGFVPLNRPRYAIVVLAEGGDSGGGTSGPVFKQIARYLMEDMEQNFD